MSNVISACNSPNSPRPNSLSPTTSITQVSMPSQNNISKNYSNSSNANSALKITPIVSNGNINNANGGNHIAINFTTSEGISPALLSATSAALPLTLNSTQSTPTTSGCLQIISTTNGIVNNVGSATTKVLSGKNGIRSAIEHSQPHNLFTSNMNDVGKLSAASKMDEPPTKMLKLINGSFVSQDSKLLPAGSLTLSQVCIWE